MSRKNKKHQQEKSRKYWQERFTELEKANNKDASSLLPDIEEQYYKAQREIDSKIRTWYQRLAGNNSVTMAEARKLLSDNELKEFKWDVNEYIKYGRENAVSQQWVKELENASAKFHITKLEALKLQTQQSMEALFGNQMDSVDTHMRKAYTEGYYHSAYEVQKGTNLGWDIASIDQKKLDAVVRKPWAADGSNFSDRIWTNKTKLTNELHTELTQMCITGKPPDEAIKNIAKNMNTSKNNAAKLVMTESAYFSSIAQKDAFKELGVERFEVIETLDGDTCPDCGGMDGKVVDMKDFEAGITAPPFHPFCRGCTAPYYEDNYGERATRDKDGASCYVPSDMTYTEWNEKVNEIEKVKKVDCLIRNHTFGEDNEKEKNLFEEAVFELPAKVREKLSGTVIDIGQIGASQYDYEHDILYIARGAGKEDILHEMGHLVENKMLDSVKVHELKRKFIGDVSLLDILTETYYDAAGNPVDIFLLKNDKFVSEYQGRIYVEDDIFKAFDSAGNFDDDLLWEFISEPFREYIMNPAEFKVAHKEFYEFLKEVIE